MIGCSSGRAYRVKERATQVVHTVKAGETLSRIAKRYGVSVESVVTTNKLKDPDQIAVGQKLRMPSSNSNRAASQHARVQASEAKRQRDGPTGKKTEVIFGGHFPVDGGVVLRRYAKKAVPPREGIVIAAPTGSKVRAVHRGEVIHAGFEDSDLGGVVLIKDIEKGLMTVYTGLTELGTRAGRPVKAGQVIGTMGTRANQASPRIEFQVRRGRIPVNPLPLLVQE